MLKSPSNQTLAAVLAGPLKVLMSTLSAVVASLAPAAGSYRIVVPDEWAQGRTLYGGMTAALSLAAAQAAFKDLPPLRSAQFTFVGPAAGSLIFTPAVLRKGRSATIVAVDCAGESGFVARTTLVFGEARVSEVRHDEVSFPAAQPPEACETFFQEDRPRPTFSRNFQIQLASGSRPMVGSASPWFAAWVRLLDDKDVDLIVALLASADALPPAAMVQFPKPGPISTMTWSIDLLHPIENTGWRLLTSTSEQAADGYSLQAMDLWSQDGRRLAAGRQLVALFV